MKRTLQILALVIAVGGVAIWAATGATVGWTKTEVQTESIEPVTEIRVLHKEKKFIAGVDFLGAAFGGAALLAGASFFFRKNTKQPNYK